MKNTKRILFLAAECFLLFLVIFLWAIMLHREEDGDYYSTVRVTCGGYMANASVYQMKKESVLIVSTAHLLKRGDGVTITFYDGTSVQGKTVFLSKEHDIGFIEIPITEKQKIPSLLKPVKQSKVFYHFLGQDDPMYYAFLGEDGTFERINGRIGNMSWYVEDFSDMLIYNYCEAFPGMSGAGMYDRHGNYCGMLIGGYETESAALSVLTIEESYRAYCQIK